MNKAVDTAVQGALAAAEDRLQGRWTRSRASLEAQLRAAQLQASTAAQACPSHTGKMP